MAKVRLDLMVDGKVKKMLRDVATTEGISMSQLVEVMLTEHLSGDGAADEPMHAVADLLWIQRLQEDFRRAMELGGIHSFRSYANRIDRKRFSKGEHPVILYVGKGEDGFSEGDIVLEWHGCGADAGILSTYDGVLRTVRVRMEWTDGDDGSFVPYGFRVWPRRGGGRIDEPLFEWRCPASWPGVSVEYQGREGDGGREASRSAGVTATSAEYTG